MEEFVVECSCEPSGARLRFYPIEFDLGVQIERTGDHGDTIYLSYNKATALRDKLAEWLREYENAGGLSS